MSLQQIPNPTNMPLGVTVGYQRQNTNIAVIQTGLDTTEPYDNGSGLIIVPTGGIIENNGVMFKIVSDIVLQKSDVNTAYWIAVNDNEDGTAGLGLVTRPGAWNPAKKGCYYGNRRTLNWVSLGNLYSPPYSLSEYETLPLKGDYKINLPTRGWKFINIKSGLGGGDGYNGGNYTNNNNINNGGYGGGGGIPSWYNTNTSILFYDGGIIEIHIGGNGTNGYSGSNGSNSIRTDPTTNNGSMEVGAGGGGGGGAGGSGESSYLKMRNIEVIRAAQITGGNGGRGGLGQFLTVEYGSINISGGNGGDGGNPHQMGGNGLNNGGNGGDGGQNGESQNDGSPGGYCTIYSITN